MPANYNNINDCKVGIVTVRGIEDYIVGFAQFVINWTHG